MADETPAAEWLPLDSLRAWERNPKRHPEEQIRDLMRSITRFGWGAPILARMNGEVVAGHGRLEAAKRLGLKTVPVRRLNLDPTEASLLALADNRLTEVGTWDDAAVAALLAEAAADGVDVAGLGWTDQEIEKLLGEKEAREKTNPELLGMTYNVMITCRDEQHQAELIERLEQEGEKCRPLML